MANTTKLKPRRVNSFNEPSDGKNLGYKNTDEFKWQESGPSEGYIKYEDYEWNTLTGSSITIEDISNNITPSSNFTVSAGTVKPGIEYVLRVNTGSTAYTMTLGTGIQNPNSYSTELKPNTINQFKFIALTNSTLELEGIAVVQWGEIEGLLSNQTDLQYALDQKADDNTVVKLTGNQTVNGVKTFGSEPVLPSKTTAAGNNPTKPATEKQVYDVKQDLNTLDSNVVKTSGDQTVNGTKTFGTSPVVPSKTTDATNTGTAIATEAQVYNIAQELDDKQDTLTAGEGISIVNNVISSTPGKQAFFKTQAEYDALPSSKNSDGNLYIIVDTHTRFMPFADLIQLTPAPDAILAELNKYPKEYAEYYYENGDIQIQEYPSSQLPRVDAYLRAHTFINGLYVYQNVDTNLNEQELSDIGIPQEYIETALAGEWAATEQETPPN